MFVSNIYFNTLVYNNDLTQSITNINDDKHIGKPF